ncbi:hypothetical protein F751_3665 [Auxenochlorella protothecoides]|uniref:Uncharacterized protein n=1 Tax=Auxenochlorella protothecoides TaxID=3075 RepID=A0A087SJX3_AUXPR|nr:hypothetical protein F751_3665 [Auxenochlorella protothecoides]KFM26027.1 hypothetical protein F751_3665 [Auxenochlorella protothecoides]
MASDCVCDTVALLLEKLQVPADGPLGDDVGRFLAPVVTVLSYPDLLRYPALVAALGSILGRLVEEFDLGLERSEEIYAGARSLVEAWGVLDEQAARLLAADLRGILDLLVEGAALTQRADLDRDVLDTALLAAVAAAQDPGQGSDAELAAAIRGLLGPILRGPAASTRHLCGPVTAAGLSLLASERLTGTQLAATSSEWMPALTVASCDDVAAATTLLAAAAKLQAGSAAARGPGGGAAQAQPVPGARPFDDSMLGGFIATQGLSSTLARQLDGEAYGETAAVAVGSAPLFVAERLLAIAGGALTRWARTAAWARQPAGWAPDLARALGSLLAAGPLRTAAGDFLAAATRLPLPAAFSVLRRMHPGMWPEEAAATDSPDAGPASGGRGSGARRVQREETRRPLADFQAAFGVRPLASAGGHWRHAGQQPARAGPSAAPAACETIDLTEGASPARPTSPQEPAGAGGAPPLACPAIKVISPPSYKRAGGSPVAKDGLPPWLLQRTPASPGGRGPRAALPPAVTLAQLLSEVLSLSPGSLEARPLDPGVRMEQRFESMDAYVQARGRGGRVHTKEATVF